MYRTLEAGTTGKFTWTGSTAPASLSLQIKTASETVVASVAAVQSVGGYWFAYATLPDSYTRYPVDLVAEWTAVASTHLGATTPFVWRLPFSLDKRAPFGAGRA